jgi:hypothetical protein
VGLPFCVQSFEAVEAAQTEVNQIEGEMTEMRLFNPPQSLVVLGVIYSPLPYLH